MPFCQEHPKLGEQLYATCQFASARARTGEVGGATTELAQPCLITNNEKCKVLRTQYS